MHLLEISYEYYKNKISQEDYDTIIEADPTNNKAYSKWLLNLFIKDDEAFLKAFSSLELYTKIKLYDTWKKAGLLDEYKIKDIMQFPSLSTFLEWIDLFKETFNTELENKKPIDKSEYKIWYEDSNVILVQPLTYKASRKFGCNSHWCTAADSDNGKKYFNNYTEYGILLIHRTKKDKSYTDKGYQLYIPTVPDAEEPYNEVVFMDIDDEKMGRSPDDKDFYYGIPEKIQREIDSMINMAGGYPTDRYIKEICIVRERSSNYLQIVYKSTLYNNEMEEEDGVESRCDIEFYDYSELTPTEQSKIDKVKESGYLLNSEEGEIGILYLNYFNAISFEDVSNYRTRVDHEEEDIPGNITGFSVFHEWASNFDIDMIISNYPSHDEILLNKIPRESLNTHEYMGNNIKLDTDSYIIWYSDKVARIENSVKERSNILPKRINETAL